MASGHSFNLGQRVNIPGIKNIQGLVSLPNGTNEFHAPKSGGRHWYFLRWLSADGEMKYGWFGDHEMIAAQEVVPVVPVPVDAQGAGVQAQAVIKRAKAAKPKKTTTKKR